MKALITIIIILQSLFFFGQSLQIIETTVGKKLDFSEKVQKDWKKIHEILSRDRKGAYLTKEEIGLIDKYNGELMSDMWSVLGDGCSWYCGAGGYKVETSSELKDYGEISYSAERLRDFNYKTSWVEGVKGYGVGETIEFTFPAEHPRLTKIIIVNGYVKSKRTWLNNSRVKKLKMFVNEKPFAIINLKDVYAEQYFKVKPIGNSNRMDLNALKKQNEWKIKFKILEVFKGDKYDDTAITEIYFDGLDVHCLKEGTLITMFDKSQKKIENLRNGDFVLSYNINTKEFEKSKIFDLVKIKHDNLVEVTFSNGSKIICTKDHPFLSINNFWVSINPTKTKLDYKINNVKTLKTKTEIISNKGIIEVAKINDIEGEHETFTILKLSENNSFIANGIVTRTE